ncbi:MAG TPA: TonB family protein [Hymenobacter sp.]|jgi:TonB family protein|uniref:TonB family protein n=1 Tax=Hymenobacter sp. TaxID=1898978 RepID=UPI002ED927C4
MSPADSPFTSLPAPGPHPATAELRAYAAGTLPSAEQQRIEAHMLDCDRCAELVEGFSMSDAAATDRAVAALRSRLQARIGTADPAPVAAPRVWPRVVAAAALLGAVAGGIWTLEQRDATTSAPIARTSSASVSPPSQPAPPSVSAPENVPQPIQPAAAPAEKPAEYAAVTVAPHRRTAAPRSSPRARRKAVSLADKNTSPNTDAIAMASADKVSSAAVLNEQVETNQGEAAPPVPAAAPDVAAAPVAKKARAAREESPVPPDSAAMGSGYSVAGVASKAKAVMPNANRALVKSEAASVLNTPMPATISIKPAPVGGTSALRDYLRREALEFEPEDNARRLTGTVRVKFIVGADGKVTDLKVTRGLRDDYDAEAIRMLCDGPGWQPGVAGGRRAPLPMEITVTF